MPPIRTSRNAKPPPAGFDDIEDTLLEFSNKMKDAENASHEGKKRHEVLWPIFQISHQREWPSCLVFFPAQKVASFCLFQNKKGRHKKSGSQSIELIFMNIGSRYIYELYYEKEAISKQLYDWLLKNKYADAALIAKWKKQGYEKVFISPPLLPSSSQPSPTTYHAKTIKQEGKN